MNEKINGLWNQVKFQECDCGCNPDEFLRLKFAELIVRECATAFEAEVDSWKEMDPYQGSIKRQGTKAIKRHFGVEE